MKDPLQEHIEKLKIMKESARRRSEMYSDLTKLDDKNTTRSLRALTKASAPGKRFKKLGSLCYGYLNQLVLRVPLVDQ